MSSIMLYLCGISQDEFKRLHEAFHPSIIANDAQISRDQNQDQTIDELKNVVQKDLNLRSINTVDNDTEVYQIDKVITVTLNNRVKAVELWKSIEERSEKRKIFSGLMGATILVGGGWESISDESPLQALGTLVLTSVATFFTFKFQKLQLLATSHRKSLENLPFSMAQFRKKVIEEGLSSLQKNMSLLQGKFKNFGVQLFTDKELMLLLGAWVQQKKKEYPTDEGFGEFIATDSLFERELEELPDDNLIKQAVKKCKKFVEKLDRELDRAVISKNFEDEYEKKIKEFRDMFNWLEEEPNQNFLTLFKDRYKEATQRQREVTEQMLNQALGSLFREQLELLHTDPAQVINCMKFDPNAGCRKAKNMLINLLVHAYFKRVFAEVFMSQDVNNYPDYINWARGQFKNLSPETSNKNFLLKDVIFPEK